MVSPFTVRLSVVLLSTSPERYSLFSDFFHSGGKFAVIVQKFYHYVLFELNQNESSYGILISCANSFLAKFLKSQVVFQNG